MTESSVHVVVLAAGKGTRMRSDLPKVLHRINGVPMLTHVLRAASAIGPASTVVVLGHKADIVREAYAGVPVVQFVVQDPQLGTGHALLQALPRLAGASGDLLLLYGDVPLLRADTLRQLLDRHGETRAAATVLTAEVDQPYGYGRIVRQDGAIARIVEERDATAAERAIREINAGIYALALEPLAPAMAALAPQNAQGEYYLPDLVGIYRRRGLGVSTLTVRSADEIRGVNSRRELAEVSRLVRNAKNEELMAAGVTLIDPATTYVEPDVRVGPDTVLHPNVYLEGSTSVGAACEIHAGARLVNATIGDRVTIRNYCVIADSTVEADAVLGPFAHLRPGSTVASEAHVGNFVELKKTTLGRGSKASHLTYLGDATIGDGVNIGAGTITCNYDGVTKHPTVIGDGAFIGSDSQLIAPVTVGAGAYVAAGSSITDDVPADALGIARGRQVNKPGWAKGRRPKPKPKA
jgi:bifunctional UDP-N-acetylglucosamine pyrophosphorylase / glucosamine-1-phosphate N-acetyltransferase